MFSAWGPDQEHQWTRLTPHVNIHCVLFSSHHSAGHLICFPYLLLDYDTHPLICACPCRSSLSFVLRRRYLTLLLGSSRWGLWRHSASIQTTAHIALFSASQEAIRERVKAAQCQHGGRYVQRKLALCRPANSRVSHHGRLPGTALVPASRRG